MLAIYNESKTNWIRATINNKTSKITASRVLNDGKVRYLDVLISNDIDTSDVVNAKSMNEETPCTTLYEGKTAVKFKSKDLKPFITKSDKFNTDVLFINISLKGKIIKNMSGNHSILAYLIAQGELFLIVSMSDKDDAMKFELVLHDPNIVADTTYTFEKKNDKYYVASDMVQTDAVITKPTYKVTRFRPARPTNVIFVCDSDESIVKKVLKYPDSHNIKVYIDNDEDDIMAFINPLKESGYKAATLFVNRDEFTGSDDEIYGNEYDMLKSNFKFLNILLNNGKILRK